MLSENEQLLLRAFPPLNGQTQADHARKEGKHHWLEREKISQVGELLALSGAGANEISVANLSLKVWRLFIVY